VESRRLQTPEELLENGWVVAGHLKRAVATRDDSGGGIKRNKRVGEGDAKGKWGMSGQVPGE